jgi:hypothetical protein
MAETTKMTLDAAETVLGFFRFDRISVKAMTWSDSYAIASLNKSKIDRM